MEKNAKEHSKAVMDPLDKYSRECLKKWLLSVSRVVENANGPIGTSRVAGGFRAIASMAP